MWRATFIDAGRFVVGVFIAAIMMHTWLVMGLVAPVMVSGSSMAPQLEDRERLLIDRTAFAFRSPRRWEVVVFRSPEDANDLCVKRIAGLPGEIVEFLGGDVWINGRRVANPLGIHYELRYGDRDRWRLGPTEFGVLGDNTAVSDDSRSWPAGPGIDAKLLVGRALGVR